MTTSGYAGLKTATLLQHHCLGSSGGCSKFKQARQDDSSAVGHLTPEAPFPISATVARFVDRLAALSTEQWAVIQNTIGLGGPELSMIEASRNAAVALAVRDLISRDQFDHLYGPFRLVIPLDSLEMPPRLD